MLTRTFQHIRGIGAKTEKRIWAEGLTTWKEFLDGSHRSGLPLGRRNVACFELERSLAALERRKAGYFAACLPASLHWRLYPEFGQRVGYLDIETTGLGVGNCTITVIGLYDGVDARAYVQGKDLDQFHDAVDACSLLVTYNGKLFDLPVIRHELGIPLEHAHIDLRFPLAGLGYRGGLKRIERTLGFEREGAIGLLDGWCAVLLWEHYQRGNDAALETLLRYNLEDVVHLPALLALVYNAHVKRLPFAVPPLDVPPTPRIPFGYHGPTIARVLAETGRSPTAA